MNKERYLQIFNYLLEYSKLKSTTVKDIEYSSEYEKIIWLSEIPKCDIFECVIDENFNQENDYLLKIRKPKNDAKKPSFANLPEEFNAWVNHETLLDENTIPELLAIVENENETLYLSDYPGLSLAFQNYVEKQWLDDLIQFNEDKRKYNISYQNYEIQNKTYSDFFNIYNKIVTFDEEYELLIGIGLLYFQNNQSIIRRHILTLNVEIEFVADNEETYVKVFPNFENDVKIELDVIRDLPNLFPPIVLSNAEIVLKQAINGQQVNEDIFNKDCSTILSNFLNSINADSEFLNNYQKPSSITTVPSCSLAPALILRKRTNRGFVNLYQNIISELETKDDNFNVPQFNQLIGVNNDNIRENNDNNNICDDEIVFFPEKYNDEQIQIVEKAKRNDKILVQGPPGTGKSHTIANLICHYLAHGKNILVTAQTKRALEVLKDKLPNGFNEVAVNLLNNDTNSMSELEQSVYNLLQINEKNKVEITEQINRYEKLLDETRSQKATIKNKWLGLKVKSVENLHFNQEYQGTLLQIAEKLETDRDTFDWYEDDFANVEEKDYYRLFQTYFSQREKFEGFADANSVIPNLEGLITVTEIDSLLRMNSKFDENKFTLNDYINAQNFEVLIQNLKDLRSKIQEANRITFPNSETIIGATPDKIEDWKRRLENCNNLINSLPNDNELAQLDRNKLITYPPNLSWQQLRNDAQELLTFLQNGNPLSGMLFSVRKLTYPNSIKEKLYFINAVRVNGSPCDTIEEFNDVLSDIHISQTFDELSEFWPQDNMPKKKQQRLELFRNLNQKLHDLLEFRKQIIELANTIDLDNTIKLTHNDLSVSGINHFITKTKNSRLWSNRKLLITKQQNSIQYLRSNNNFHSLTTQLIEGIEGLDAELYTSTINHFKSEKLRLKEYHDFSAIENELTTKFPKLLEKITKNSIEIDSTKQLPKAILFCNARIQFSDNQFIKQEVELLEQLFSLEKDEKNHIKELAVNKAWLSLKNNLTGEEQNALIAWRQAIDRMPKSERSVNHRRFKRMAQEQMEACKSAIPCWIMPVHQIIKTFKPKAELFDIVIIDEASQLGPEALFLFYFAKKIIIVGDDKQTAPENVGVNQDNVNGLIDRHLQRIPFRDYYGTQFSFFDHADRLCRNRIVLKEHFRCMPEIINFCNQHFYEPANIGLYPLKQYDENRLPPLQTIYCQDGFNEGEGQNRINKNEVIAIANKIKEICNDTDYNGKSIGVITLQGNKQANIIEQEVLIQIGEQEFHKRKIICGNAAHFQGDERDIIFLSLVTAHNHNRRAVTSSADERRYNVAVSRAKEQIWLVHSIQLSDLGNQNDLRYKLMSYFLNPDKTQEPINEIITRNKGNQPSPFDSWFEVDVYNDIVRKGHKLYPQYKVGAFKIDLVILLPNGIKLAIECDGDKFHGAEQFEKDMMRQRVLERCGWTFFRVRGAEYYSNRQKALEPLWKMIENLSKEKIVISKQSIEDKLPKINPNEIPYQENEQIVELPKKIKNIEKGAEIEEETIQIPQNNQTPNRILPNDTILIPTFNTNELLVFTNKHLVYKFRNEDRSIKYIDDINNRIELEHSTEEKIIYVTGTDDFSGYILFGYENGKMSKVNLSAYQTQNNRKKLENAYHNGSKLLFIQKINQGENLELAWLSTPDTKGRKKLMIFDTNYLGDAINARHGQGVQVMNFRQGCKLETIKITSSLTNIQNKNHYKGENGEGTRGRTGCFLCEGDIF